MSNENTKPKRGYVILEIQASDDTSLESFVQTVLPEAVSRFDSTPGIEETRLLGVSAIATNDNVPLVQPGQTNPLSIPVEPGWSGGVTYNSASIEGHPRLMAMIERLNPTTRQRFI